MICSICGKVENDNHPVPDISTMTYRELIDELNSIGCQSFVLCQECSKKYGKKQRFKFFKRKK